MKIHVNIIISGKVQKIGFRYSARQSAVKMGINGFVQNRKDGSVYIEAEGSCTQVDEFLNWCRKGPIWAVVTQVETSTTAVVGYHSFEISHSEQ